MRDHRCAVAVLPADDGDAGRLIRSVETAKLHGLGDFRDVDVLDISGSGPREAIAVAAETAAREGYDRLLAVSTAETLAPDLFVKAAPALRLHDAVWGAAGLVRGDEQTSPEPSTRLAAQDLPAFFHLALRWWIGPAHLVTPAAAFAALANADGPAWLADYLLALWRGGRAFKTAQTLTLFHERVPPVPEPVRAKLIEALDAEPVFIPVRFGPVTVRLPYTGRNPTIERAQTRGQFFEHDELAYLADRLPRGISIIDVGANTGNHTLFFASVMGAGRVVPIEPEPRAAGALRAAIAENGLANVDPAWLGHGVGAEAARMRAVVSQRGGLGATRLVPDPDGPIPVLPLDAMIADRVDLLKIDVEGMEMAALAGARATIARHRPILFVEVLDETIREFMAWSDGNRYRIERLFPDKTHCDYVLVPEEIGGRSSGR